MMLAMSIRADYLFTPRWEPRMPVRWDALPVKENPLADCRDGVLRLIERRKLRLQAVLCKGHDEGITR